MLESPTIPAKEQLEAKCEALIKQETLSGDQFVNFIESICHLIDTKSTKNLCYTSQNDMGKELWAFREGDLRDDKDGLLISVVYGVPERKRRPRLIDPGPWVYAEINLLKKANPYPFMQEKFVVYNSDANHVVQFDSVMGWIDLLDRDLRNEPSYDFSVACRKVWEIYNSSNNPKP